MPLPASPRFNDLTGRTDFGRWEVLGYAGKKGDGHFWWCRCVCGNIRKVFGGNLTTGRTESCGCLRDEATADRSKTHGMSHTRTYKIWWGMISRRYNKGNTSYQWYGGVGVSVCDRWRGDGGFENFLADMGEAPDGLTIERKESKGDYTPDNCCWATTGEQAKNRSNTVMLTVDGVTKCMASWAEEYGIALKTLWYRINKGWPHDRAVKTPVGQGRQK